MIRLRPCTTADTPLLVQALNECLYQGYRFRVVMTAKRFLDDARAHDVDLSATFLALEGDVPIGVALTARRGDRAWIAGMGVHPTRRGSGLGGALLGKVQERLLALSVREILLEVLVDNEPAKRCYLRAGFVARRRYSCFRGTPAQAGDPGRERVSRAAAEAILRDYAALHAAEQCWQRDVKTLGNRGCELSGLSTRDDGQILAALLYSESAIQDVAFRPGAAPLADLLPGLLHKAFGTRPFAIVNVPDDDPLHRVLRAAGFEVYAEQLDMRCAP